jgi:formylglycine-generating enzyme required for sulfatase activity
MNKIFSVSILFCCYLLLMTSCGITRYDTRSAMVQATNVSYVASTEVSVGDWMVYLMSTSFTDSKQPIRLGDHYDQIRSKLPALGPGRWDNFAINALLRKSHEHVNVHFSNDCKDPILTVSVPKTAWDSIREFKLMDLPIAGITYEQAMEYIKYKQDVVNSCGFKARDTFRYACFLPTPEQFQMVQTRLDSTNTLGCNLFNYANSLCADCPNGEKYLQNPVSSRTGKEPTSVLGYFPDPFGLYNFKGNVAEMTSVKGIAMGGSCMHYASEAFDGRRQAYAGSAQWLGFRVWYRKVPER